jgi:hypothetical protein
MQPFGGAAIEKLLAVWAENNGAFLQSILRDANRDDKRGGLAHAMADQMVRSDR